MSIQFYTQFGDKMSTREITNTNVSPIELNLSSLINCAHTRTHTCCIYNAQAMSRLYKANKSLVGILKKLANIHKVKTYEANFATGGAAAWKKTFYALKRPRKEAQGTSHGRRRALEMT